MIHYEHQDQEVRRRNAHLRIRCRRLARPCRALLRGRPDLRRSRRRRRHGWPQQRPDGTRSCRRSRHRPAVAHGDSQDQAGVRDALQHERRRRLRPRPRQGLRVEVTGASRHRDRLSIRALPALGASYRKLSYTALGQIRAVYSFSTTRSMRATFLF
ncbi:MAG: hypothetical protein JWN75_724 [Candidatus Saccharibacteria bacterium]|nr:hypothetical protein [Candidatus Saccharibacteria bacterium]